MSTFTRKAFPPLQIGSTNRSGSVNVRSRANPVNEVVSTKNRFNQYINSLKSQFSTRKDMNNAINRNINISVNDKRIIRERLNNTLAKARTLQFSNTVTANNGSTRKLRNNKNTRGQVHAFTQVEKPSMFNFSFLNPFAKEKKAEAAAYQKHLVESRKSVPKSNTYTKFFTTENRKEKRKWATNEQAQAERKKVNFGPREAKMMANLVAKYNSKDDMIEAIEGLNVSDDMKLKFRSNIYQLYNNLKANLKLKYWIL
jgi:hypothetical protein